MNGRLIPPKSRHASGTEYNLSVSSATICIPTVSNTPLTSAIDGYIVSFVLVVKRIEEQEGMKRGHGSEWRLHRSTGQ